MCFQPSIIAKRKRKKSKKARKDNLFYLRPIIFPTKKTLKQWKKEKYQIEDPCTMGIELTNKAMNSKMLRAPGLMEFAPQMAIKNPDDPPDKMSFCIRLK